VKELKDIIELRTHDTTKRLSFATRYLVQVHFTFDLTVLSDKFGGTSHFCVYKGDLETLCNELLKMQMTLSGTSILNDNDSDGFVAFTISENGQLQVCGQVGGSHEDHFVKFEFRTDQTCIPQFVDDFKKLLEHD